MKTKALVPAILLLFACSLAAQPVGHLTVFSDEGDKFFLILNGERQNVQAQTNIRVEDLPNPQYSAKVIFEDQTLGELSRNLFVADETGALMDVTYKIKRDKNTQKPKLGAMPYSAVPVRQGFVAPSNVYVVRYGNPAPAATVATPVSTGTVTQTTTTTTTGAPNTVGANVNINGVNMNMGISITDPLMTETHTTTTSTSYTTTSSTNAPVNNPPVPAGCFNGYPMSSSDFSSALSTVKNQSFEDTKLKTAKQVAAANCMNTSQITQVCNEFSFEESKLEFAKYAYDFCTEPKNYFKLNNVFSFSTSVDELTEYVQGK